MLTDSSYTRLMTPTAAERLPSLKKRTSLGPSFRRYPSTPRLSSTNLPRQSPDLTMPKRFTNRLSGCVTKKVLEKTEAKSKIQELEALLKEICQSGFDEAYIYNEEHHANKLAGEFVQNLKQALTKLIDRFRARYLKARRATLDMFQTEDDTRFDRSSPTKQRNPHTSTQTLPLTVHGAETEDSITTATSNFFRPATTRSGSKPLRICATPQKRVSNVKSAFTASPKQSQIEIDKELSSDGGAASQSRPVSIPVPRFVSCTPEPKLMDDSTPAASVKQASIQTTSFEPQPAARTSPTPSIAHTVQLPKHTQPNFFMNTIAYDVHLYMRMLYLQRKGNLEGAQIISQLFTNPLQDIQEAVHPQILRKGVSVSPRELQLYDFDSEVNYRPGVKFGLDPRYINFASRAVSPGPAVHNAHAEWKLRPGGAFTKDKTEFTLELPSADTPAPNFYRPSRGKCSYGSIPKLLRRGGVRTSRSPSR